MSNACEIITEVETMNWLLLADMRSGLQFDEYFGDQVFMALADSRHDRHFTGESAMAMF